MYKIFFLCLLTSCSYIQRKGRWGSDAFTKGSFKNVKNAIVYHAKNPQFWAPLGAAAVVYGAGQDKKISDWAVKESPLFDGKKDADAKSDDYELLFKTQMYLSVLLPASWEDGWASYAKNKLKGAAVTYLSYSATRQTVTQIKIAEPRQRPNRLDNESFPSGHSARASSKRHLIAHNLEASDINPHVRNGINTINGLMTASVMWARVEAQKHHLSDVLAGYSVGYFLSGVFYDSLLNLDTAETFVLMPTTDKVTALYSVSF